ncbi:hypothetical protein C5167_031112 [Papaver somniferum]|nr:hypothetical protein C5167_031112 [Papaver somniferum]
MVQLRIFSAIDFAVAARAGTRKLNGYTSLFWTTEDHQVLSNRNIRSRSHQKAKLAMDRRNFSRSEA